MKKLVSSGCLQHGASTLTLAAVALVVAAPGAKAQTTYSNADSTVTTGTTPAATTVASADTIPASSGTTSLGQVIVTGTRTTSLEAAESPAPVQILSAQAIQAASGNPNLIATLAQIVPSLTAQAFGGDMANQTLQAKMRGLSPNQTLVLVDGKRRHTTSNLAVLGGPYQGGAGVDLNFIPLDAIDHIEVLTEGAAAQYGSDAIAGVVNIILKKKSSGGNLSGSYGGYMDEGGQTSDVSGNAGFKPMDGGYFNVTGEVRNHGHSQRGGIDERVVNPANLATYPDSNMQYADGYPYLNKIQGDAAYHTELAEFNAGIPIGDNAHFYAFGTWGDKNAASYENYRLPTKISYTDSATGETTYMYPYGFSPEEAIREQDYSLTAGIKGTAYGWNWDLSSAFGNDKAEVYTLGSGNAYIYSQTGASPVDFYDGYWQASQWTQNLDFSHDFNVGLAGPLNVAWGGEVRRDTYAIGAGNPSSYIGGGAQSYPGFTPTDAGHHERFNYAGYVDLAGKPIDKLYVDLAGRYEHYSDFGSTSVGKLTGRYDFTEQYAMRGTISSGFRAPTLAEEYYSSTNVGPTTAFVQLPPNSAAAGLLGLGTGLQPEKSINYSVGFVMRPLPKLTATLDLYQTNIRNRIVGSGTIVGTAGGTTINPAVTAAIEANGNQLDPDVVATGTTGVNIFTNGISTRTRGADFTVDYPVEYVINGQNFGKVDWSLGATYNQTSITSIRATPSQLSAAPAGENPQTLFDATALSDLSTASPRYVINLGALWTYSKYSVNVVEKVYGPSAETGNDDGDNSDSNYVSGFDYFRTSIGTTLITNLDLGYQATKALKLSAGALNLFNRYPDKINGTQLAHENNPAYGDNAGVQIYPSFSPFGIDGGYYYVKANYAF
jgi:iron complex outermembrane recepter protein